MRLMLFSFLAMLVAAPSFADVAPDGGSHVANAYAADSHRLLYHATHYQFKKNGQPRRLVLYTCPDGKAFARKTIAGGTPQAPDFQFVDALGGYREGVRESNGTRTVYVQRSKSDPEKTAVLPNVKTPVIDAGFDAFVTSHWKELMAGKSVKVQFLVPSKLKFYDFIAKRAHVDAKEVRFRLDVDSWFSFALPHIEITYDRRGHTLRRFQGPSNVRGADGDNVNVVIKLPPDTRHDSIADGALQKARNAPLDGRCKLH